MRTTAALLGPGLFTLIYTRSIARHAAGNMRGAAWLLSTIILLGATILMLRVTGTVPPEAH